MHSLDPYWSDRSVTEQKLEIQLRVKIDSLYLTTTKHSGGEDKLAVFFSVNMGCCVYINEEKK